MKRTPETRTDEKSDDRADDISSDDPHKVEKLMKLGQENIDPNEGTE